MLPFLWGTWSFLCSLLELSYWGQLFCWPLCLLGQSFYYHSLRQRVWSPYLPYIVRIILFWFACSRSPYILLLVASFEWPCLVCHSRSPHCQSGVYSTCLDLIRVFLLFFKRFKLPLLEIFFYSHFIIWCSLRVSFLYSFGWLL